MSRHFASFVCGVLVLAATMAMAAETSALPDYKPAIKAQGTLRSWGNNQMAVLVKRWETGFRKYHSDIRFEDNLMSTAMAQWGLHEWAADMAVMGRQIWPYEFYGSYRRSYVYPVEIAVATGSYDVPGKSSALVVFVHKSNPINKLTLQQLDRIFGAERTGGWQGLDWVTDGVARGPASNIRTWGQLGLTGEWTDKPIVPYGPPSLVTGAISYFQSRVSGGSDTRNERLREYEDRQQMARDLANDRYGIGYAGMNGRNAQLKPIALAEREGRPYVLPSKASVANRTYPLTRTAYIYFTIDTKSGDLAVPPVDPKVKEFLRYVLSRQGQQEVAREGGYLPLTPELIRAQLQKLDNPGTQQFYRKDRRDAVEVKMSVNETLLPALAQSLGYLEREGLRVQIVDLTQFSGEDYLMQEPLNKRQIDASYNWFHHVIFGVRHGFPVKAVLLLNDAPGVQVLVANREKERIRSAADFKGKRIAEGAGYSTKSVVTNYLALKAGLPPHSYTAILKESEGREAAVLKALNAGQVDLMVFLEPMTSALLRTKLVTPIYDLTSREKTVAVFGAPWPAQCLFVTPRYIEEHPDSVQRLVNAWVRTMRYVNSHTAEQIIDQLPPSYFEKRDRKAVTDKLRNTLSTFAQGDYTFSPDGVQLVVNSALASSFDDSAEGIWRRIGDNSSLRPEELYTNRFVEKAMREIAPSR